LNYSETNTAFIALLTANISTTEIALRPIKWKETIFCEQFKIWNRQIVAIFKNFSVFGRRHIVV